MKKQFKRTDRVAEFLQRELSQLIQLEIKDPRLPQFVTISSVNVSADLNYAKVYFTLLAGDKHQTTIILNNAASYLRSLLAKVMKMYTVPQLSFVYDESLEYGRHLSKLIDEANPNDGEV
jgi:ribosome-binding factor A